MFKLSSQMRTTFVVMVALVQLSLLPATHVLHLECQHTHGHAHACDHSTFASLEAAWKWCWSTDCCDHSETLVRVCDLNGSNSSGSNSNGSNPRSPIAPQHDEHSCSVCLTAFAACLATTAPSAVLSAEPLCEVLVPYSPSHLETPRISVLSRGPPVPTFG